jgi:predicted Zn-dependent protease
MVLAEAALSPPASYREARLFLEQAEAVRPLGDPLLLSRLASVSLRAQDPGAAAAAARAALRLSPAQTDLQVLLSRALLQEGRVAEAQGVLGEVLSSLPPGREAIGARLLLLRSRLQQGDLLTAQREVEQLLLEHPEGEQRVQARLLLARLGLMQKPPLRSEALGLLQSVVSEAPGLVEGRQLLGQLLGQLGRPAEAMVQLREALRLSQADPSTAGQG